MKKKVAPKRNKKRATTIDLELRHNEIASLLLLRYSRAEILQISRKKWGVGSDAVDKYIAQAKVIAEREIELTRSEQANALHDLMREAKSKGDMRLVFDIRRDIGKLGGVYPAERHKHEFENVSDTDLINQARELARQIAENQSGSGSPGLVADRAESESVVDSPTGTT